MAYAVFSDIQSEFKDLELSASTKITEAEVTEFIAQAEAKINACLAKMYTVPITDASDILIVKFITIQFVKARVQAILEVKSPSPETDQEPAWKTQYREAKSMLSALCKGTQSLLNTPPVKGDDTGVFGYGFSSSEEVCLPVFKRCEEQW